MSISKAVYTFSMDDQNCKQENSARSKMSERAIQQCSVWRSSEQKNTYGETERGGDDEKGDK